MKNIGFIGVGYMGYGIAKNILKHKNKLSNFKIFIVFNTLILSKFLEE